MSENRDWLSIITPCRIAIMLALIAIIYGLADLRQSQGWSFLIVIIGVVFLVAVGVIDLMVTTILKKKAGLIWLIETILLVITIIIFKNYYGFGS